MRSKKVELLAPAKGYDSAVAAIDYGADAIYMGGARFGARAAAGNSVEDIARAAEYAHQYSARLYVTMNTLLMDSELADAQRAAREVIEAGADALIIQDMAYCRMGLDTELHGSTQLCNMDSAGVRFWGASGLERVVLERNLSVEDIERIARETDVELECFVHGAICVGCSGECYLSRAMNGGRSGNRGECGQPCRLSYDLVDGAGRQLIANKHLLSVKDFNLANYVGRMMDAGVRSFKVEGRLKDLSYTKNIVAYYRTVIDGELSSRSWLTRSSVGESRYDFEANPAKSFTRGESSYLFLGRERGVATFDSPKSRGELIGHLRSVRDRRLKIDMLPGVSGLSTGDGICYVGRSGELFGSSVNEVDGSEIILNSRGDYPQGGQGGQGAEIWRNFDRVFEGVLSSSRTRRVIGVECEVESGVDYVSLTYIDIEGHRGESRQEGSYEVAQNREKMEGVIETQARRLGDTIFECRGVDMSGWGGEFIPSRVLGELRREAAERLIEARKSGERHLYIYKERMETRHSWPVVGEMRGVTNAVARRFYLEHGAESIEPSLELMSREQLRGHKVMHSRYCLRREIGECLREGGHKGALYLVRGEHRLRLEFDCARCEMSIVYE